MAGSINKVIVTTSFDLLVNGWTQRRPGSTEGTIEWQYGVAVWWRTGATGQFRLVD